MLARDTHGAKLSTKQKDSQAIIYETALFVLLETRHKLKTMAKNSEIDLTTAELNKSLCTTVQKLTTLLDRQLTAADLWQSGDRCPQCELRLSPFTETCICGCKRDKKSEYLLNADDLSFLISENCTD